MHDMKVTLQYYLLWHEDYSVRPCVNPSVRFLIKLALPCFTIARRFIKIKRFH